MPISIKKELLRLYGYLDVLPFYAAVASKLKKFLHGKEIATKTWIPPKIFFLKRGSKDLPLFIEDFSCVNEKMLKLREKNLKDVKNQLTKQQEKIWLYFVPRKLIDFFYATNTEGAGKKIDRIFFDLDRGEGITSDNAKEACKIFIDLIKKDEDFNKLIKYKLFIMWTGSSFHVYLLLAKQVENSFYNKYIAYSKAIPLESFTGRWAQQLQKKVKFKVTGGHEKIRGVLSIDPSQTPSGKLGRVPFSLHMKSATEVDGIALPVTEKDLKSMSLIKRLKSYDARKVLAELNKFAKFLIQNGT